MEKRNVSIYLSVPLHFAFIHKHSNGSRCKCFRARPNVKQRVGRDRLVGAYVANTKPLHVNDCRWTAARTLPSANAGCSDAVAWCTTEGSSGPPDRRGVARKACRRACRCCRVLAGRPWRRRLSGRRRELTQVFAEAEPEAGRGAVVGGDQGGAGLAGPAAVGVPGPGQI